MSASSVFSLYSPSMADHSYAWCVAFLCSLRDRHRNTDTHTQTDTDIQTRARAHTHTHYATHHIRPRYDVTRGVAIRSFDFAAVCADADHYKDMMAIGSHITRPIWA